MESAKRKKSLVEWRNKYFNSWFEIREVKGVDIITDSTNTIRIDFHNRPCVYSTPFLTGQEAKEAIDELKPLLDKVE